MDLVILRLRGFFKRYKVPALLILAIVLIVFPLVYDNDYYKSIVVRIIIYVILASALNVINGFSGQFILGQAGLMCVGSYTAALLSTKLGVSFWIAMPLSGILAALLGLVIVMPTFKLKGVYLSIVTMGFAEVIRLIALNWNSFTGGPMGVKGIPSPEIFGIKLGSTNSFYYICLAIAAITIFCISRILNSRVGRAWNSIREDQLAASSLGVEVSKYKAIAFMVGAFFSGIGGGLIAYFYRFISSDMYMTEESFNIISMMVVGGQGTLIGPAVGAVVVSVLNEFFRMAGGYRLVLYSALIMIMLWWRPQGLLGVNPNVLASVKKLQKTAGKKKTSAKEGGKK